MTDDELLRALECRLPYLVFPDEPDLMPFTAMFIQSYMLPSYGKSDRTNVKVLGNGVIDYYVSNPAHGCQIIKFHDELLKLAIILPKGSYDDQDCDQFIFYKGFKLCDDDHGQSDAITPDEASAYLISLSFPGSKVVHIRQDNGSHSSIIIKQTGDQTVIQWPTGLTGHKTWTKR